MKIIVVGSISSGMTLAERLAAGEGSAQITLYEKAAYCSCGTRGLPHYLGLAAGDLSEILAGCALSARSCRFPAKARFDRILCKAHKKGRKAGAASQVFFPFCEDLHLLFRIEGLHQGMDIIGISIFIQHHNDHDSFPHWQYGLYSFSSPMVVYSPCPG